MPESPRQFTTREGVLVTLAILAVMSLQLVLTNGLYLFSKYFWLDELYTYAVVADPELGHAWSAMRGGMDSMPLYQLVLRGVSLLVGPPSEVLFRAVSFGSILLALVGIYALLRRGVGRLVALTAVLAVWAHPLTLINAFDARFYGPFLACAVWFCYALERRHAAPNQWQTAAGLAAASLALCAIHVFGVLAWPTALVPAAVIHQRWRQWWPALIGPAFFPVLWVLFLQPQRAIVTIPTWEAAFSWLTVASTVEYVLFPGYLATVLVLTWAVMAVQRVALPGSAPSEGLAPTPAMLLLTSLSLVIPLLVVLSLVLQPTLTSRYFIPAIAALAPAVAYGVARLPRWGCAVILAVLIAVGMNGVRQNAMQAREEDRRTDALVKEIRELPADRPVVFEVPFMPYVIWHYAPDLRERIVLLDFETGQIPYPSNIRIVTRDLARAYGRFYDAPRLVPWAEVGSALEFYVVRDFRAWAADAPPPTLETRYPGFTLRPIGAYIAKATRR